MIKRLINKAAYFLVYRLLREPLSQFVVWAGLHEKQVFGNANRLHLSDEAVVQNAVFNLSSGHITVERNAFFGHNVSLLTGTHDYKKFGIERMREFPDEGRDIVVKEGAWLASNVTVIGPCLIGRHAVVGACSLVLNDVPDFAVVAGVPAQVIRYISADHAGNI